MPINFDIEANEVRVVDEDGSQIGVLSLEQAVARAEQAGLDLVLLSPNAVPPVCKIMDIGKYKYEQSKKANLAKKKQHVVQIKEVKLRATTDIHDVEVKVKHVRKFLEEGDKVKLSVRFRGRELAYTDQGAKQLQGVAAQVQEVGKVERAPLLEGKQMIMILAPTKK